MHITFDVDGVLANFAHGHCQVLKDLYGIDIDPDECKSWFWSDWVDGLTKEMEDAAWDAIFNDPKYKEFWQYLPPLVHPGEVTRINKLAEDNIVSFITTRSANGQHKNVKAITIGWLGFHGFATAYNTHLTGKPGKGVRARSLGTHVMIDDNGPNALDLLDSGVAAVLLSRAYNEAYQPQIRERGGNIVSTLGEFLSLMEKWTATEQAAHNQETIMSSRPAPAV